MNKKSQKPVRKNSVIAAPACRFWWIGLGVTTALVIAVLFLLQPRSTVPADFEPQVIGAPSLAVLSSDVIDHGDVPVNQFVESTFKVQNVGDKALIFLGNPLIQVVEGCCPPETSVDEKVLEPGEVTTIRTRFTMHQGMDGPHDFRVHVVTNDPNAPERELKILSNWIS
ncbi:MAG: DUF1573 domain-containing protein [Anaerolineae bacterium]|nr:DUF1573 domain-containing protein [Anaerolineae bacterium]